MKISDAVKKYCVDCKSCKNKPWWGNKETRAAMKWECDPAPGVKDAVLAIDGFHLGCVYAEGFCPTTGHGEELVDAIKDWNVKNGSPAF